MSVDAWAARFRELERHAWSKPCPRCRAPVGAPCADLRSTCGKKQFGRNTHRERREAIRG